MSYAKLRGKIKEVFGTIQAFADAMMLDTSTISAKLNNKSTWKREDIELACELLNIPIEEVYLYFFTQKVGKAQLQKGDSMKEPDGTDLLTTLVNLLAEQEQVTITYQLEQKGEI